jgi:hypothetical protein
MSRRDGKGFDYSNILFGGGRRRNRFAQPDFAISPPSKAPVPLVDSIGAPLPPGSNTQPDFLSPPPPPPQTIGSPDRPVGAWYPWQVQFPLTINLPQNALIESVWLSNVYLPNVVGFVSGSTPSAGYFYQNQFATEMVPIPSGTNAVTLVCLDVAAVELATLGITAGIVWVWATEKRDNPFAFKAAAAGAAALTLTAPFTVPTIGTLTVPPQQLTMAVSANTLQNGQAIYLPALGGPTIQNWWGQIIGGGGTTTLTVITTNYGSNPAGTIFPVATPVVITDQGDYWAPTPVLTSQNVFAGFGSTQTMSTVGTPIIGQTLWAVVSWSTNNSTNAITPPPGWTSLGTATNGAANQSYYYHEVVGIESGVYVWSFVVADSTSGILCEFAGADFENATFALTTSNVEPIITPTIVPQTANSYIMGMFSANNSTGAGSLPQGWGLLGYIDNGGFHSTAVLALAPSSQAAINCAFTFVDSPGPPAPTWVAAIIAVPPAPQVKYAQVSGRPPLGSGSFAAYQAIVAARPSLIHWWKLAEIGSIAGGSAADSVGTANGTYSSVATASSLLGGPAAACSIAGGTGNLATLGVFTWPPQWSIEFLFYYVGGQGNSGVSVLLSNLTTVGGNAGVEFNLSWGSTYNFDVTNGAGGFITVAPNSDVTSAYAARGIVTLINSGTTLAAYINGWPIGVTAITGFTPGTLGICLGQRSNTGTFSANGVWSNVSIYSAGLANGDVQAGVQAIGV